MLHVYDIYQTLSNVINIYPIKNTSFVGEYASTMVRIWLWEIPQSTFGEPSVIARFKSPSPSIWRAWNDNLGDLAILDEWRTGAGW